MGRTWLDENGKLFGLINPIDLAVIILLLALGIKVVSDHRPVPLDLKTRPVTVGLLVRDIPPFVADSVTVGQDLFLDGRNYYLGKIQRKTVEPAELILESGGKLLLTRSPRNVDLRLELQKRGGRVIVGPTRSGVYLGKLAVRVGERLRCHTLYTSLSGEVYYLRARAR